MMIDQAYIVVLFALIALGLTFFAYSSRRYLTWPQYIFLFFLRAAALFLIFLVLYGLQLSTSKLVSEKPKLSILVDDSQSIAYQKQSQAVNDWLDSIEKAGLSEKYDLQYYTFGRQLKASESLRFDSPATDINNALEQLESVQVQSQSPVPVILITDGNSTFGQDYRYADKSALRVYPICIGDTVKRTDLSIERINVNKYAFVGHNFPVEVFLSYRGTQPIKAQMDVKERGTIVYSKEIEFSPFQNSASASLSLKAERVGVKTFTVSLRPLKDEKNTLNNVREIGVEVIDDRIKIALISKMSHPDIGELIKSIKSNSQNQVDKISPDVDFEAVKDYNTFVFYQPDASFKTIFEQIHKSRRNYLLITGSKTDWAFINKHQNLVSKRLESASIMELAKASVNNSFSEFSFTDIGFSNFSPLLDPLGAITFQAAPQTILYKNINGIDTDLPLLATVENNKHRTAYLFGEGIWHWRMQAYLDEKNFEPFDEFMRKLLFYLSSSQTKNRLNVDASSFYYQGHPDAQIIARFFDKNYNPDFNAQLGIEITNRDTGRVTEFPMASSESYYYKDISDLDHGIYYFKIKEEKSGEVAGGSFQVIAFNQEQLLDVSDYDKLKTLSYNTGGAMLRSTSDIEKNLLTEEATQPLVTVDKTYFPFIEFKWLLALIALLLFLEWFTRKYTGLV